MGANLVELYTQLEEKLGKETAKVLVEAIEELTEEKRNSLKFELKEELLKEVATKENIKLLKDADLGGENKRKNSNSRRENRKEFGTD